ncbi:MAG: rhodanese-like domain-containing protein [Anaerolineae bacterium]|nr:rhodanese-like domain-containing protein [Anaerolineae bacterium]
MFDEPFVELSIDDYQAQFTGAAAPAFVLVDVREADEYAAGHLPGAINLPLSTLETQYRQLGSTQPLVLVCARGGRSAMAAEFLAAQGYAGLYNLSDGTLGWMLRGLPLER